MRTSLGLLASTLLAFSSLVVAAPSRIDIIDDSTHSLEKRATCAPGTFKFSGECVKTCPINTYANSALRKCSWCSSIPGRKGIGASKCTATEALKCPLLYLLDGRCVKAKSCPVGTWADKSTHECTSCPGDGKTCDGWGILTCKTKLKYGRSCVDECPERTYLNASKKECFACTDKDARQCTQRAATKCTFKYLDAGVCRDTCSAGKYAAWYTRTCEPCKDKNAITCTPYKSLTCKGNLVVKNGVCVDPTPTCETDEYLNVNATCIACSTVDDNALTCNSTAALSCGNSTFLSSNGTCVSDCVNSFANTTSHVCEATGSCPSATTFLNSTTNACINCNSTFNHSLTCDPTRPLTCAPGFPLNNGTCVGNCTIGQYLNSTANTCNSCSTRFPHSISCTGDKALVCDFRYPLQDGRCVDECDSEHSYNAVTGICDSKVTCPISSGTFANATLNTCIGCDRVFNASLTCNSTTVFSCRQGTPLKNGRCVGTCDIGTDFFNSTTNTCENLRECTPLIQLVDRSNNTCTSCDSIFPHADTCDSDGALSCQIGFYPKNGECLDVLECNLADFFSVIEETCVDCNDTYRNASSCDSNGPKTCIAQNALSNGTCQHCQTLWGYTSSRENCTSTGPATCTEEGTMVNGRCVPIYKRYSNLKTIYESNLGPPEVVAGITTAAQCAGTLAPDELTFRSASWNPTTNTCIRSLSPMFRDESTNVIDTGFTTYNQGYSQASTCSGWRTSKCDVIYFDNGVCHNFATKLPCDS